MEFGTNKIVTKKYFSNLLTIYSADFSDFFFLHLFLLKFIIIQQCHLDQPPSPYFLAFLFPMWVTLCYVFGSLGNLKVAFGLFRVVQILTKLPNHKFFFSG